MRIDRTRRLLCAAGLGAALAARAQAQTAFPARPVRIIVPQPPGSSPDIRTRQIAQKLADEWRQPVVVDNRPGASGAIAMELTARAAPDGYTTVMANTITLTLLPQVSKVGYDPFRDFVPVTKVTASPLVLVTNATTPFSDLAGLIAHARANPGKLNLATPGTGSTQHLLMLLANKTLGITLTHVPYKGGAQTTADLVGGQVQLMFDFPVVIAPHIKAGRLRPIAIASATRLPFLADVPTFAEQGHAGLVATGWQGLLAPAGTPAEVVARLNAGMVRALNHPDVKEAILSTGTEIGGDTPEQFAAFMRAEYALWGRIIGDNAIRVE